MTTGPSTNYSLRPNKHVERRLILKYLMALEEALDFRNYVYLGMGSIWFTDFRLFHANLHFQRMISMEMPGLYDRAQFNVPYSCIEVLPGEAGVLLPKMSFDAKPHVVWLDYEAGLGRQILGDLDPVWASGPSGTIVIVTLNASNRYLRDRSEDPEEQIAYLRDIAGDLVPPTISASDLDLKGYARLVAEIALASFDHGLAEAGRDESFYRLWNFRYRDTAPMVTVGGVIADEELAERIGACMEHADVIPTPGSGEQFEIDVPHLTPREKAALDQLLPRDSPIEPSELETLLDFSVPKDELSAYCRFYLEYPVFREILE